MDEYSARYNWWLKKRFKYGYYLYLLVLGLLILKMQFIPKISSGFGFNKYDILVFFCGFALITIASFMIFIAVKRTNKEMPDLKIVNDGFYIFDGFYDHYVEWGEVKTVTRIGIKQELVIQLYEVVKKERRYPKNKIKSMFFKSLWKRTRWSFRHFKNHVKLRDVIYKSFLRFKENNENM